MTDRDPSQPAPRGGPSAGAGAGADASAGAGRGEHSDVWRHLQQAWSAIGDRIEHGRLMVGRAVMRALIAAAAMGAAIAVAWAGMSHLISGAAEGLAERLGSAWQADVTVGATCLALATAVLAGVALRVRRRHWSGRQVGSADAPPAAAFGDGIAEGERHDATARATDRPLADAFAVLRNDVARALDVRAHIARHPLEATASAFVVGLAAAFAAGERRQPAAPAVVEAITSGTPSATNAVPPRGWLETLLEDLLVPIAARCMSEASRRSAEPEPAGPTATTKLDEAARA